MCFLGISQCLGCSVPLPPRSGSLSSAAAPPPAIRYPSSVLGGPAAPLSPIFDLLSSGATRPAGPSAELMSDSETGESASLLGRESDSEAPLGLPKRSPAGFSAIRVYPSHLIRSFPLPHPSGQPSVARSHARPGARLWLNFRLPAPRSKLRALLSFRVSSCFFVVKSSSPRRSREQWRVRRESSYRRREFFLKPQTPIRTEMSGIR
jgi:hypothetical protein